MPITNIIHIFARVLIGTHLLYFFFSEFQVFFLFVLSLNYSLFYPFAHIIFLGLHELSLPLCTCLFFWPPLNSCCPSFPLLFFYPLCPQSSSMLLWMLLVTNFCCFKLTLLFILEASIVINQFQFTIDAHCFDQPRFCFDVDVLNQSFPFYC